MNLNVLVLPGDGIGPEIVAEAVRATITSCPCPLREMFSDASV